MKKDQYHDTHVQNALKGVQFLDEISGPDDAEGYILILQDVIKELENRIEQAKSQIKNK